jgi:hypothetical protein
MILNRAQTSYQCFHHLEPRSGLPLISLFIVVPALLSIPISYHVLWSSTAVLIAFAAYGGAVTSFTLIYRLSPFHPLAKHPGPAIAKTSKLWAAYVCARGDLHRYYKSLHDLYGDIVRVGKRQSHPLHVCPVSQLLIGPNELSIRDPSLIHPVLGQGGLPKGPRAYISSRPLPI